MRDHDARFEDVYAREFEPIRRWLARRAGRDEDADDLAAEVFARALRAWDSYRGDATRRTWLFSIARNTLLNSRRSRARDATTPTGEPPEAAVEPGDSPAEEHAAVSALLARIPSEQARRAVVLRYVVGCSVEEVAVALDTTPTAVTTLTHRALAGLREELS